jgi:hypothetical protein
MGTKIAILERTWNIEDNCLLEAWYDLGNDLGGQ